jgi:hypothetical protein
MEEPSTPPARITQPEATRVNGWTARKRVTVNTNNTSRPNTLALLGRCNIEVPETNDRAREEVRAAMTPDVKKSTAQGQRDSEVFTENRVSERTVATLIESPFRISPYLDSRFWAVYEGDDLVAVTVYRRGAEEVRRRLQAATDLKW